MAWYPANTQANETGKHLPTFMEDFSSQVKTIGWTDYTENHEYVNLRCFGSNIICAEEDMGSDGIYDFVYKFFNGTTGSSARPFSKNVYIYNSNWDHECITLNMDGYPFQAIGCYDARNNLIHLITDNYNMAQPWYASGNPVIATYGNYYTFNPKGRSITKQNTINSAKESPHFYTMAIYGHELYAINNKGELVIRNIDAASSDPWLVQTGSINIDRGHSYPYSSIKKLFSDENHLYALADGKIISCDFKNNSFQIVSQISCQGSANDGGSNYLYIDSADSNSPFCKDGYVFLVANFADANNNAYRHLCKINLGTGKLAKMHTTGNVQESAAITPSGNIYAYRYSKKVSGGSITSEDYSLEVVAQSSYKSYYFPLLVEGNTIKSKYKIFPLSNNLTSLDDYTIMVMRDGSVEIGQMDIDNFESRALAIY